MKGYLSKKNKDSELPKTNNAYKGIFSLPLYPELKIKNLKKIIKILKQILIKV